MPALLVLALIVVPILELAVLIQVGQWIGLLPTLALLVAAAVLGGWLLRREGARTWRAFQTALGTGRMPAREVADGALVILGGALMLSPGFVTDAMGLLLILPPTRAVARRLLTGVVSRRLLGGRPPARRRPRPGRPTVIEGEAEEVPPRELPPT